MILKTKNNIILIQFLTLPNATVYGGIAFLTAKSKDSKLILILYTDGLTQRYLSISKFLPCCVRIIPQYHRHRSKKN